MRYRIGLEAAGCCLLLFLALIPACLLGLAAFSGLLFAAGLLRT